MVQPNIHKETWHPLEWNSSLSNSDLSPTWKMEQPNIHTGTWHPLEWNSPLSKQWHGTPMYNGTAQYSHRNVTPPGVEQFIIYTMTCHSHKKWNSPISTKGPGTPWSRIVHYQNTDLSLQWKMEQPNIHTGTWHPWSGTAHYLNNDMSPPCKMEQPNIHTGTWYPLG